MTSKSMFDKEIIEDLRSRMFEALQTSGQFENVAKENGRIVISLSDVDANLFVETISTYAAGDGIFSQASGLRIVFSSSLDWRHKIKSYMVPRFERQSGKWFFSRSKLLKKTSEAVTKTKQWVAIDNENQRLARQFGGLVEREFGPLGKAYLTRSQHRSERRLVIELSWGHIILSTWNEGETFGFESIQPRKKDSLTPLKYPREKIKGILAKLGRAFMEEQNDRAN